MKSIRQLSITIWEAAKRYVKRVADLQDEVIRFNSDMEKELYKDKK